MGLVHLLYIDDMAENVADSIRDNIQSAFTNLEIDMVPTNQEALRMVELKRYDVVLYDLGNDRNDESYPGARQIKEQSQSPVFIAVSLSNRSDKRLPEGLFHDFINSINLADGYRDIPQYRNLYHACKKQGY